MGVEILQFSWTELASAGVVVMGRVVVFISGVTCTTTLHVYVYKQRNIKFLLVMVWGGGGERYRGGIGLRMKLVVV